MRAARIERRDDIYTARDADDHVLWTLELRLDMSATPFRDEGVWPSAGVAVIAGGPVVYFVSLETGEVMKTLSLDGDLFGHLGPSSTSSDGGTCSRWIVGSRSGG